MTDTSAQIQQRIDRLRAIAETLEDGEIGLPEAKQLREEADELLEELQVELETDDGQIMELDPSEDDT